MRTKEVITNAEIISELEESRVSMTELENSFLENQF